MPDFSAFLIHKQFVFSFVYAVFHFVELFVILVLLCKVGYGLFVGVKRFTKLGLL